MGCSREHAAVAWTLDDGDAGARAAIARLARSGAALLAIFRHAEPELIAEAFAAGADAGLSLRAGAKVVVAQVRAVLRRAAAYDSASAGADGLLQVGDLCVDVDR